MELSSCLDTLARSLTDSQNHPHILVHDTFRFTKHLNSNQTMPFFVDVRQFSRLFSRNLKPGVGHGRRADRRDRCVLKIAHELSACGCNKNVLLLLWLFAFGTSRAMNALCIVRHFDAEAGEEQWLHLKRNHWCGFTWAPCTQIYRPL